MLTIMSSARDPGAEFDCAGVLECEQLVITATVQQSRTADRIAS